MKINQKNLEINPQKLDGCWNEGWALDLHTLYSIPIIPDNGIFYTKRTPLGEELNLLKYKGELARAQIIAETTANFLKNEVNWNIDMIIPIPPSDNEREFQPVYEIAKSIGRIVGLPVDFNTLRKVKSTIQLKDIEEPEKRREILKDAFDITFNALSGNNVLIFDDIYRSGETLKAVCRVIMDKGNARGVYALTITKTRSKR